MIQRMLLTMHLIMFLPGCFGSYPEFENLCADKSLLPKVIGLKLALNETSDICGISFKNINNSSTSAADTVKPTPGNSGAITFTQIDSFSLTLTWTPATDNISSASNLQYIAYKSLSNNIDSVALAEANGTPLNSALVNDSNLLVQNLNSLTLYYFTVVVRDEAGNKANYSVIYNAKYLFVTSSNFTGNLGGLNGADAKCEADTNKPNSATYKAMIGDDVAPTRQPCFSTLNCVGVSGAEAVNWVLLANTIYIRPDKTIIGQTSFDRVFVSSLFSPFESYSGVYWSGLENNWTVLGASSDCTSWTSGSAGTFGNKADINVIANPAFFSNSNANCNVSNRLVCVEQ